MKAMTVTQHKIISRAEAKRLGLKRYFTGKECKRGHVAERIIGTNGGNSCVECHKIIAKAWRERNLDRVSENNKSSYLSNLEKRRLYHREYYAKNRDKMKKWHREYGEKINDLLAALRKINHPLLKELGL